ncbi:MAG: chemotaxis protein CheD [Vicinamibacterales bacterium]
MKPTIVVNDIQKTNATRRIVIGIGECAVSPDPDAVIVTHALGSCVAVCLWDPVVRVGGMIHVLLPDSTINPTRAAGQPAAFADTGIPLLFRAAYELGVKKSRCRVHVIGGATISTGGLSLPSVGKRNILAVRQILWRNGVLVEREEVGGTAARNVTLSVADGAVHYGNALTGASVL